MSRILLKILNYSVFPFSAMIIGKLIGLLIGASYLNTIIEIENNVGEKYMMQLYTRSYEEMLFLNKISNLTMIIPLSLGILGIVLFHAGKSVKAKNVKKLKKKKAVEWLVEGNDGFLKLSVWLTYFLFASYIIVKDQNIYFEDSTATIFVGVFAFAIIVILHEKIDNLLKNFYTITYA